MFDKGVKGLPAHKAFKLPTWRNDQSDDNVVWSGTEKQTVQAQKQGTHIYSECCLNSQQGR